MDVSIIPQRSLPGGRHFYMHYGTYTITSPDIREYSVFQLKMLIDEIESGTKLKISPDKWKDQ